MSAAFILHGYAPAIDDYIAKEVAAYKYVIRFGPGISLYQVQVIADLSKLAAYLSRLIVLDMHEAGHGAIDAVAGVIEEAGDANTFIVYGEQNNAEMLRLASVCTPINFPTPDIGTVIRDLQKQGMSLSAAASTAQYVKMGYSPVSAPDAEAIGRARSLIESAELGDIDLALKIANNFDSRSLMGLRHILAERGKLRELVMSYDGFSEADSAVQVVWGLVAN